MINFNNNKLLGDIMEYKCLKCDSREYVEGKIRTTGSGLSRFLNLQNNLFITISCSKCGFTELYKGKKSGKLGTVVDLFTN
ncbi:MAG: zinc ribbon domain-containing protein [Dehalococcoidia bacterium]